MGTPASGRWIVAAALAAVVLACAWILAETVAHVGVDDAGADANSRGPDATPSAVPDAAPRRVVGTQPAQTTAADPVPAVVEIDDAPLPEGATATIRGTVRDDLGRPIVGAGVTAFMDYAFVNQDLQVPGGNATSRTDGSYAIGDLDPSIVWRLEATADGHVAGRTANAVALSARRLDATYDFVLTRHGSIEVTAADAAGSPVPCTVRVVPFGGADVWGLREDSVPPGRWRVLVETQGFAGESRVVQVVAGAPTRAEFRLTDEVQITGTFLDSDGAPLAKREVVAIVADASLPPYDGTAVTAADGSFRIRGLRRTLYALAPAEVDLVVDAPETVAAPASGVRLQVRDESKVTFRLVYPAGYPEADRSAEVHVVVTALGTESTPSPRWDGDTGTVRVPGGEDVGLAITVLHCLTVHRRVSVRAGELADIGDVRPEPARDIAGRVVDAHGDPVAQALVLHTEGGLGRRAVSDDGGRFTVERLPRADTTIDVEARGFVTVRVPCPVDGTYPLTVTLSPGGALWVRCETKAGEATPFAAIRLLDARGAAWPFAATSLDGHGECAVRLPPGTWRIDVAGCDPVAAEVRENATTSVRVRPRVP